MTIASANLLPRIFSPGDTSLEGLSSDSIQGQSSALTSGELSQDEAEFLALINRELEGLDSMQALENKDLLSLINELEDQFVQSDGGASLNSEWLQVLKSHFGAALEGEGVSDDAMSEALIANQQIADSEKDSLIDQVSDLSGGEVLPLMWQEQAAEQQKKSTASDNGAQLKQGTVEIQVGSIQKGNLEQTASSTDSSDDMSEIFKESDFARNDSSKDKSIIVPSSREHFNGILKSAEPSSAMQNNAPLGIQALNPSSALGSQVLSSSLQTLTLHPQAQSGEWGQAIGERVALLINSNLNRAEIRIDPPHLGKLDIQIQLKDDSAVVMIQTQHVQTRDLVESASARLREFLQDAGYSSVDVNVSHREHAESGEGYGQQNRFTDADVDGSTAPDQDVSAMHASDVAINGQLGVIDYFA